jgi:pSer/pThr/pTyr-binding forkhead associated (FHA) protein
MEEAVSKLVIEDESGNQTVVPVDRDEITIGRLEGNSIRLTERNVSRRHAKLLREGSQLFFENISARYGTRKNGESIASREGFLVGDVFLVGDYRFYIQATEVPPPQKDLSVEPVFSPEPTALIGGEQAASALAPTSPSPTIGSEFPRLVILNTPLAGTEIPLTKGEAVIGRGEEDNDIVVEHRSISRHHAKIAVDNMTYRVIDLGSANGVKVNGEPYQTVELRRGDVVELGNVKMRFIPAGETGAQIMDIEALIPSEMGMSKGTKAGVFGAVLLVVLVVGYFLSQGDETEESEPAAADEPVLEVEDQDAWSLASAYMGQGQWEEAIAQLEQVPIGDEEYERAQGLISQATISWADEIIDAASWDEVIHLLDGRTLTEEFVEAGRLLVEQAQNERRVRAEIYNLIEIHETDGNHREALEKLREIPEGSYYRDLVLNEGVEARILAQWWRAQETASNEALSVGQYDQARGALSGLSEALGPAYEDQINSQLAAINAAEETARVAAQNEAREAEARETREDEREDSGEERQPDEDVASTQDPREHSVELIAQAQRLGMRQNYRQAIDLLEEAKDLTPREPRIYMMLYQNYAGLANSRRAADALERYLRYRPNDSQADRFRELLEELRGE